MPKLFLYDYDHNDMMKCRRNVNFHEMDTEPSTRKNNRFWLLLEIFEKYTKKNYYGSVKKSKLLFKCHLQIDKKINNVEQDPRRKTDSKFNIFQAT